MADGELHDALRDLALEVAALLSRDLDAGAQLPFEVVEQAGGGRRGERGRRRPVLYRYRPLTAAFIGERWPRVRELEAYGRAVTALASGAPAYLRHRGLPGAGADEALRDLIERLFDDATRFELPEERFERLAAEVEATLAERTLRMTVIAPIHGVRIAAARVTLRDGLALARRSALDSPPVALEGAARWREPTAEADDADPPAGPSPLDVYCVVERARPRAAALPIDEARVEFRRLLTALRLCGAGGTALGALAWARAGNGAWHPAALGVSARTRPESWELRHHDEPELRDLLEVLALSRHGAVVGWALGRFEMGCERELESEALSDYLLALRALLGEPDLLGPGAVAPRLAALCAPEAERPDLRRRVELAFSLERALVGLGTDVPLSLDAPHALVREVEQHLRAVLRDVLCGYLPEDLRRAADEMASGEVPAAAAPSDGIRVRDTRRSSDEEATEELPALAPVVRSAAPRRARRPVRAERRGDDLVEAAVTPSIDWDADPPS